MAIDKAQLEKQLKFFETQREQMTAKANQAAGAEQAIRMILGQLDDAKPSDQEREQAA